MGAPTLVTAQEGFREPSSVCKFVNRLHQVCAMPSVPAAVFLKSAVPNKAGGAHRHGTPAVSGSDRKMVVAHPGICKPLMNADPRQLPLCQLRVKGSRCAYLLEQDIACLGSFT